MEIKTFDKARYFYTILATDDGATIIAYYALDPYEELMPEATDIKEERLNILKEDVILWDEDLIMLTFCQKIGYA